MRRWYTEKWDANGKKAKWHDDLPEFAAVRDILIAVQNAGTGETVRVLAPSDAAQSELDELERLGAQRI